MAQYQGIVQGTRGEASRLGSKKSGLSVIGRGWKVGARVFVSWNEEEKRDEVRITIDGGSNGASRTLDLGTFYNAGGEIKKV